MADKPKVSNSLAERELDKAEKQFQAFDQNVKELTMDRMSVAPLQETEPQTKIAQRDIEKMKEIYLKPDRTVSCADKFNEKFRSAWEFDKEYVQFIAEHKEMPGEIIEVWTKPFAGVPAQFWKVPTNIPIWAPRFLAEQLKSKVYHRLVMQENQILAADGMGSYTGKMVADTTIERLTARPVSSRKSIFMGANNF